MFAEPLLKDSAAGARHLSDNDIVLHYDAGPAERLERLFERYLTEAERRTAKDLATWLSGEARAKNSKIAQIFNHAESRQYLKALMEFSPHFMIEEFYSMGFCTDFLQCSAGGVSTNQSQCL
jgi:hypothetical protein